MILHRLFLQPLPLDRYWLVMVLPMIAAICVVYKTIKLEDISQLPRQACALAVQISLFMVLASAVLWIVTKLI